MTKYIILDVETTIKNRGSPYTTNNELHWVGLKTYDGYISLQQKLAAWALAPTLTDVEFRKLETDLVVGSNLKFDLGWMKRAYDLKPKRVFDIQLAFFILRKQRHRMPSLDEMAEFYGLEKKVDVVKLEYWEKGIDTPDIPKEIMSEYLQRDLDLTEQIFHKIQEEMSKIPQEQVKLIQIHMMDLLTLLDMEYEGIYYNKNKAENYKNKLEGEIDKLVEDLGRYCPGVPINFNSSDHLSCLLFGGTISVSERIPAGMFKTGEKVGQVRYKLEEKKYELPGFVKPKKEWALLKEGYYSSKESVLRQINKPVSKSLLKYAELVKLHEYFVKMPSLIQEKDWSGDIIHCRFNQTVAVTGRLSSADPNLQNLAPEILEFFESRKGLLVSVDAKALEWVAIVYLSQDPVAMKEIIDGVDQHTLNQNAFGLPSRHIAKIFVFRLIYGGTEFSYAKDPDFAEVSKSPEFWKGVIEKFYDKYQGIAALHKRWMDQIQTDGWHRMPTGRVYTHSPDPKRFEWPRTQIINYPVQGLGADLMAICRVLVKRRVEDLKIDASLCSTVHDSIYLDGNVCERERCVGAYEWAFKETPKAFEKAFGVKFNLPLRCEITVGPNMGQMEPA